jgi:phosphatidylinositol kinase/protein kinase (PI-3  family)
MTKKQFREQWQPYFISFNDAELYAISVSVYQMKPKNHWNQRVGKVWDAYMAQYDKQEEELVEETQPQDGQSVH